MTEGIDKIVDECIDRLNRGEDLDTCLADFPHVAGELEPMLQTVIRATRAYPFVPSKAAKQEAWQRFTEARAALQPRGRMGESVLARVFGGPRIWATVAAVALIVVVGYFGLRPALIPAEPGPDPGTEPGPEPGPETVQPVDSPSPQPSAEGNFVFLISDEPNAIDDFASLSVVITKIGLLPQGSDGWLEFEPEIAEVDLVLLQGDRAQEIWRGDIPAGEYGKVFIYVDAVRGVLRESEQGIEVKLPSGKLQMAMPFHVGAETVTSFTYDLTVVAAGGPRNDPKYILKPVVNESGIEVEEKTSKGKGKKQ